MFSIIKNILAFFGAIYIVLTLIGLFVFARWQTFDKTAYDYTMNSIPAIFTNWDFEEFKRRADSRMFVDKSEEEVKQIFEAMSVLGKFQSTDECQGNSGVTFGNDPLTIGAQYVCKINFENDSPVIVFMLSGATSSLLFGKSSDGWKILNMNANSDYLVKKLQSK